MMPKFLVAIFLMLLFAGCASTIRYTEKTSPPVKEKKDNPDVVNILTGVASFYADEFHGRKTANGEIYDMNGLTAAHPFIPFNTMINVTNLKNKKSVIVRVNDRMPFRKDRIIDLSLGAATALDMVKDGIIEVQLEILEGGEK